MQRYSAEWPAAVVDGGQDGLEVLGTAGEEHEALVLAGLLAHIARPWGVSSPMVVIVARRLWSSPVTPTMVGSLRIVFSIMPTIFGPQRIP
ncbi:hypothetical protein [Streptomyces sp. NBC_00344]|uniref:hypothetical protein n=1 Tax=Streptomyces sp. NBC_00344 TaxID=2975720 RepID=UPI002E23B8AA